MSIVVVSIKDNVIDVLMFLIGIDFSNVKYAANVKW
jgi:hypothetical protein